MAAQQSISQMFDCINNRHSFILEAGAGAGKTYSLIRALRYLIETKERELLRRHQKIACITYTNVARDEIEARTDRNPVILSATIHAFCWSLIKDFQTELRSVLPQIGNWSERLTDYNDISRHTVEYELGYPKISENTILLAHDDILPMTVKFMEYPKFRSIFINRYPILFIDEYQDTDSAFVESLQQQFLESGDGPLIGFFGDHWQKIYGNGCGKIEHEALTVIEKRANFRSVTAVVECLNRMRSELIQEVSDPDEAGSVSIYHTNSYLGTRRNGNHWAGDLPAAEAHRALEMIKTRLGEEGWSFTSETSKILMLTHNVLAEEQGYRNLAAIFSRTESYIKKEDPYIAYFADILEPACSAYEKRQFGEMFAAVGRRTSVIRSHAEKAQWAEDMNILLNLRETGTIGSVINHVKTTGRPRLSVKVESKERELEAALASATEEISDPFERLQRLKNVSYKEVSALTNFIEEKTPFATNHGVKGAEFENVLVVIGRGWNQYNFGQMLEWATNGIPSGRQESFVRNRNLFYVACSRPKKRLAILFTQQLSDYALSTLANWFGERAIHNLNLQ